MMNEGEHYSGEISGWGYKDSGNWSAGTYRIEIWYNEMKMIERSFMVY